MVRTGLRKDGMTLGHKGFGQELHIVAEANSADFEVVDVVFNLYAMSEAHI